MSYCLFTHKLVATLLCLFIGASCLSSFVLAQSKPVIDPLAPIYVTARVFQLSAPRGQSQEVNDQVFRVTTASHSDEAKWMVSLKKLYPGFKPALLQTVSTRVFRTSKPAIMRLGQMGPSSIDVFLNGAQSPGESEDKPGTTVITEINFNQGTSPNGKPTTLALQPLEVENGKTYFYAVRKLKFTGENYVGFLRKDTPAAHFANEEVFLAFAFSIDLEKPQPLTRNLGERDSVALQNDASKKVQPMMPTALKETGLGGKVQVRVEITPDGKVTKALTHFSSFPEMNEAVIVAARQWEFAATLFAENKQPVSGLLTFEFPAAAAAGKQQSAK